MSDSVGGRAAVTFTAFPQSGYYVLANEAGRLIADFGGPDESPNPGHQHAGIFSYELSLAGRRVVVDAGTPSYESGEERQRARGTAAHNTVRIDGADQFEVWKAFRVGRRARVSGVNHGRGEDHAWISAAHDGYRRLGVEHRRAIVLLGGSGWVIIDWFRGSGRHRVESFVHLHPEIEIVVSGHEAGLPEFGYSVLGLANGRFEVRDDWYSARLGQRIPARTLVRAEDVRQEAGGTPIVWTYGLLAAPASGEIISHVDHDSMTISAPNASWNITADSDGLLRITRIRE